MVTFKELQKITHTNTHTHTDTERERVCVWEREREKGEAYFHEYMYKLSTFKQSFF